MNLEQLQAERAAAQTQIDAIDAKPQPISPLDAAFRLQLLNRVRRLNTQIFILVNTPAPEPDPADDLPF